MLSAVLHLISQTACWEMDCTRAYPTKPAVKCEAGRKCHYPLELVAHILFFSGPTHDHEEIKVCLHATHVFQLVTAYFSLRQRWSRHARGTPRQLRFAAFTRVHQTASISVDIAPRTARVLYKQHKRAPSLPLPFIPPSRRYPLWSSPPEMRKKVDSQS